MKKILVIDDEPSIRVLLQKMLEREGHTAITASDGDEGMQLFEQTRFDLVITDIIMPGKEGIEIIMEITKKYPDIPVIAISGGGFNAPRSYLNIALAAGAAAVLEKPVEKDILLSHVQKMLA
ncbi:MAG: response regulator [Desulfotignum sp.]|nr:response regulator [Desulfotignum sp.]